MCVICTPPEMGNLDGAAGATSSSSLEFGRGALGAGVIANQKYSTHGFGGSEPQGR
jgi:hypothetical protein